MIDKKVFEGALSNTAKAHKETQHDEHVTDDRETTRKKSVPAESKSIKSKKNFKTLNSNENGIERVDMAEQIANYQHQFIRNSPDYPKKAINPYQKLAKINPTQKAIFVNVNSHR